MSGRSIRWVLITVWGGLLFAGCSSKSSNNANTSAGGSGGASGSAGSGSGGEAGVRAAKPHACMGTCASDNDCQVVYDSQSYDVGLTCNNNSCNSCTTWEECVPFLSGWVFSCTTDASCAGFATIYGETLVCIDLGAEGRCAISADIPCGGPLGDSGYATPPDTVEMPSFETGDPVQVCGHYQSADCRSNACALRCNGGGPITGNVFCNQYVKYTSKCDASEVCVCNTQADCVGNPSGTFCTNGRCGCETNADCAAALGKECVQGFCSCSTHDDCIGIDTGGFDNLSPTCVSLL